MRLMLILGIMIFCFSCKKEINPDAEQAQNISKLDSLSDEKVKLNLLLLSNEANKAIESFEDFQNLRSIIKSMHNANPFYVKKYADSVDLLIGTFKENLAEDLNINTINSRITVLSTESGLLKEISAKKYSDPKKLLDANTRLIKAYNSMVIQLNELSLAIPENIEKELLRESEKTEE